MPNMTLAVPEAILKKARKIAVEKNTTLSVLVRDYLAGLANRYTRQENQLIKDLEKTFQWQAGSSSKAWKREELHER